MIRHLGYWRVLPSVSEVALRSHLLPVSLQRNLAVHRLKQKGRKLQLPDRHTRLTELLLSSVSRPLSCGPPACVGVRPARCGPTSTTRAAWRRSRSTCAQYTTQPAKTKYIYTCQLHSYCVLWMHPGLTMTGKRMAICFVLFTNHIAAMHKICTAVNMCTREVTTCRRKIWSGWYFPANIINHVQEECRNI